MGQAKRRGTFEERMDKAVEKQEMIVNQARERVHVTRGRGSSRSILAIAAILASAGYDMTGKRIR